MQNLVAMVTRCIGCVQPC